MGFGEEESERMASEVTFKNPVDNSGIRILMNDLIERIEEFNKNAV